MRLLQFLFPTAVGTVSAPSRGPSKLLRRGRCCRCLMGRISLKEIQYLGHFWTKSLCPTVLDLLSTLFLSQSTSWHFQPILFINPFPPEQVVVFPAPWGFTPLVSGQFSWCHCAAAALSQAEGSQSSGAEQEPPCDPRAGFHVTEQCTAQGMILEFQCLLFWRSQLTGWHEQGGLSTLLPSALSALMNLIGLGLDAKALQDH